jgi:hypothetical protein
VGDQLAQFVHEELPEHLVWAELIEFEYALNAALLRNNSSALQLQDLALIDAQRWPELIFKFQDSVHIFQWSYPVAELWNKLMREEQVLENEFEPRAQAYIVWAAEEETYYRKLSAQQFKLAQAIGASTSFAEICELLSEQEAEEQVIAWIGETLQVWINLGLLTQQSLA